MSSSKNEAERLRRGIEGGWLRVSEAVAWADREIAASPMPDRALVEVALAASQPKHAVAELLKAVPGTPDHTSVMRRCLGDVLDAVEREPALGHDAARWLEAAAINGDLPVVDFGSEPLAIEDAFALAESEIYGTVRDAGTRLIAFLREHGRREA